MRVSRGWGWEAGLLVPAAKGFARPPPGRVRAETGEEFKPSRPLTILYRPFSPGAALAVLVATGEKSAGFFLTTS
jgi:hypothetical protein